MHFNPARREIDPVTIARRICRLRRRRDLLMGALAEGLFGEPAWDMLIDLYVGQREGRAVSASDLCIAAAVPIATALRHIHALKDRGLIERYADPAGGSRIFVRLTEAALNAVEAVLIDAL